MITIETNEEIYKWLVMHYTLLIDNPREHKYTSKAEFILTHGQAFEELETNGLTGSMPKGNCFGNCFSLSIEHPELTYVEGMAFATVIPMDHAWLVDKDDRVIDPTWADGKGYIGVKFPQKYVNNICFAKKTTGVLDNMEMGYPLLTGVHDYKDIWKGDGKWQTKLKLRY